MKSKIESMLAKALGVVWTVTFCTVSAIVLIGVIKILLSTLGVI